MLWQNVDPFNHRSQEDVIVVWLFQSFILLLQVLGIDRFLVGYLMQVTICIFISMDSCLGKVLTKSCYSTRHSTGLRLMSGVGVREFENVTDAGDAHNNYQDEQMSWQCGAVSSQSAVRALLRYYARHTRVTRHTSYRESSERSVGDGPLSR